MTTDKRQLFFDNVYETYGNYVKNFLIGYFHDIDIAEDAFQETFISVFENLNMLLNHPNIAGWLIITAKNKGRNIINRRNRLVETELGETYISPQSTQFTETVNLMHIDDPIFNSEKYRLLRLKYIYGYTIREIAHFYHIEQNACRVRLKRTKERARKHLEEDDE